jgi:BA14K-like protein
MHPILFGATMIAAASVLAGTDAMAQSTRPAAKTDRPAGARTHVPLPDQTLLTPPAEFNCEFKAASPDEARGQSSPGPAPAQADPDAALRAKLDYERQCYRHAEMILRDRLLGLQAAIGETIKAVNRGDPPKVKQIKGRITDEVSERASQVSAEPRTQLQCDVAVCARFYRSFNPSDCTYQPYDGGTRRACDRYAVGETIKAVNRGDPPKVKQLNGRITDEVSERASQVSAETRTQLQCNVAVCARFYRSFNPSDCTYQPYDGGTRRACDR